MTTRKSITSVAIQALLLSGVTSAQNTGTANLGDGNYISIDRFTSAAGASSVRDVTYYDGLGYPVQEQSLDANTSHGTLVRPIVYDDMRRGDANGNMTKDSRKSLEFSHNVL